MNHNDSSLLGTSPSTINSISGTTVRAFSSGSSSSCSSSESSGPTTGHKKDRCSLWRYSDFSPISIDESNDLEDRINISTGTNSHLLIRGSQINLSNSEDLTEEEVRRNNKLYEKLGGTFGIKRKKCYNQKDLVTYNARTNTNGKGLCQFFGIYY
ncbi:hypothetical protein Avbf_11829 [Armadillidium vulgare]|nr:hypothetical protein Avbf_11829 [Armadillidium vulgare]